MQEEISGSSSGGHVEGKSGPEGSDLSGELHSGPQEAAGPDDQEVDQDQKILWKECQGSEEIRPKDVVVTISKSKWGAPSTDVWATLQLRFCVGVSDFALEGNANIMDRATEEVLKRVSNRVYGRVRETAWELYCELRRHPGLYDSYDRTSNAGIFALVSSLMTFGEEIYKSPRPQPDKDAKC